jgi:hypothetical protein
LPDGIVLYGLSEFGPVSVGKSLEVEPTPKSKVGLFEYLDKRAERKHLENEERVGQLTKNERRALNTFAHFRHLPLGNENLVELDRLISDYSIGCRPAMKKALKELLESPE